MGKIILIICWIFIIFSGCVKSCYFRVLQHRASLLKDTTPKWWPFKEERLSTLTTITEIMSILVAVIAIITGITFKEFGWLVFGSIIAIIVRMVAQYLSMKQISRIAEKHAAKEGISLIKECF